MKVISVGFIIYEAQNLKVEDKELLDPLVVVRCCNNEYITKKKKKKYNAVNWEESHVWNRIVLSEIEWNVAKIEFEVQSANTFWRNDVIGVISFELKLIRNKKNHQIYGTYPILYKNRTEIQGQLRLKVIVCNENDYTSSEIYSSLAQYNNNTNDNNDNNNSDNENFYEDLTKAVVEENTIALRDSNSRFYYLYINIHKIEDVYIDISKKKSRDLYITCEFNGCHLKSSQGNNCTKYTFNECFKIPINTPILEDTIIIKVWDWNFLSNDELLAIGVLSFNQIKNKSINPMWLNLYGFHKNELNLENYYNNESNNTSLIRPNDFNLVLEGNVYLGRICISAYVERLSNYDSLSIPIVQSCLVYDDPLYVPITLLCDVYVVTGLLAENIYVQLTCGPHKKKTDCVSANEIGWDDDRNNAAGVNRKKKGRKNNSGENITDDGAYFDFLNFNGILNTDNFISTLTEKQQILDNSGSTEFYFSSRKGKIDNMKLCSVEDEQQQWDIIINVYEKDKNKNNDTNIFNNFMYSGGNNMITDKYNYDDKHNKESKLTDYQKYKLKKREENYDQRKHEEEDEENEIGVKQNNDRRIAYYRMPLKNVLLHNEKISRCPIWLPLKNISKNADSGLNCMYNIFQNGSILVNLEKSYDLQLGLNRRKKLVPVNYELRCYIYACRNIVSNFNESPNTFVHIACSGKMKVTSLVLNNSNPVFLQCLKLNITILTDYSVGLPTIPFIVVTLYEFHNNTFYFIGRCFCNYDIYLKDNQKKCNFTNRSSKYNMVEQIQPRWIKLKGNKHAKAMYPNMLWQQSGSYKRIMQEYMFEKQKDFYTSNANIGGDMANGNNSTNKINNQRRQPHNDFLHGERVGDILLYFELVKEKDAMKIPIYPMITEIKKCTLSFFCMSLENLVLMKTPKKNEQIIPNDYRKNSITHPIIVLSITSYSSYGKKKNELLIKYAKSLKTNTRIQLKNWKNAFNQQSFEMFAIENFDIDVPLDPIFDPTLNIKVYNKKVKDKYFIGETNISLIPYMPWIESLDDVLHYLQAYEDYSETINIKNIDNAFNIYKNKNAALVVTAISLADYEHTISLKEELKKYENDDEDDDWNNIPLFNGNFNTKPADKFAGMIGDMPGGMVNGMFSGMPNGMVGGMSNGMVGGMPNGMVGGMSNGMAGGMPNGMAGSMSNGMVDGMAGGMDGGAHPNFLGHEYDPRNGQLINNTMMNNFQMNMMYNKENYSSANYGVNCITEFGEKGSKIGNGFNNERYAANMSHYFSSYYNKKNQRNIYNIIYNESVYKLHDDGVPEIIKASYSVKNYPYIKVLRNKFILNVYIPPRFILYVEGDKINLEKFVKNTQRVSVDGILENYLDDILIPSIPLKKKYNNNFFLNNGYNGNIEIIDGNDQNKIIKEGISFGCFENSPFVELVGGQIKCFTKIKYRDIISEHIPLKLKDINNQNTFRNKFRGSNKIPLYLKIRVYVLRGIGINGVNSECSCNPYLTFSLGDKTTNLRNSYKDDNPNPNFSYLWESEAIFPEDEILTISVYSAESNYDKQINDIYIGSTEINLFDRWMSKEWRHMMKKNKVPIEYRPLYNNYFKNQNLIKNSINGGNNMYNKLNNWNNIFSFFDIFTNLVNFNIINGYSNNQYYNGNSFSSSGINNSKSISNNGLLEMWVEIMGYEEAAKIPIHKMEPPKISEVEIRIIIWRCNILLDGENPNKTFDLVVTSELDCINYNGKNPITQTTDVHYNCKTGDAIFNWRMVYPNISHPLNTCFLQLAVYNNSNVGTSQFLGEVNLELSKYIHKVLQVVNKFELDAELKLRKKNIGDNTNGDNNCSGTIQVTVQFIPQSKANIKPSGLGRSEPNRNPYLRTPKNGRDWNDFAYSIGFNDIYKPFWGGLRMFFIFALAVWVFFLSFIYPAMLL
ncbi:ferlin, putative [Plasmodium chabaudi adami]|uniref:Ferlin, putative n=1 Tax=Plasmodium chabaudi adami TaxID=5826 RepID=A0A1D3LLI6_PLACE|nr:ferlin, putative [Plasmodium chabaudi adami]